MTFHLKSPQSTWPFILATNAGYIVPKALYPADKIRDNYAVAGRHRARTSWSSTRPASRPCSRRTRTTGAPKPKTDNLIINYYSKSSTMKLALQHGEIDMAFRDFTPTELLSLGKASGIKVHAGNGVVDPLPGLQPDAGADEQPGRPQGDRVPDAAADDRDPRLPRVRQAAVLDGARPACPATSTRSRRMYGRAPSVAKAKAVLKTAGVETPVPIEIWWTPSHYGDASGDEYAEIKRPLDGSGLFKVTLKSTEWNQYSHSRVKQYPRSSSAGSRTTRTPRTTSCRSTSRTTS